jgi:hypothetical protein
MILCNNEPPFDYLEVVSLTVPIRAGKNHDAIHVDFALFRFTGYCGVASVRAAAQH